MQSAACLRGKAARGEMFEMTSSLLEKHPLPHIRAGGEGVVFKGGVARVLQFLPRGTGHNWGSLGAHPPPTDAPAMPDFTPLFALMGFFTHKPDHLRSPSRIVHHCAATEPVLPWLHWDIWSYSGCHLFLEEGSLTKLGSMICPFVGCISCSVSCDVTD